MKIIYELTEKEKNLFKIFKKEKSLIQKCRDEDRVEKHKPYFKEFEKEIDTFLENGFIDISKRWDGDLSPPAEIIFLTEFGENIFLKNSNEGSIICVSSDESFLKTVPNFEDPWN